MSYKPGDSVTIGFETVDATGALTDPSAVSGVVVLDGTDQITTVIVTKKDTGRYKAAFTVGAWTAGQTLELRIEATIAAVATAQTMHLGPLDSKRLTDLYDFDASSDSVVLATLQPNYAPMLAGEDVVLAASQPNYAPMLAGEDVVLATAQPNYAPAKAGDAMALTDATVRRFVTWDTGQGAAVAGSVARLAQGGGSTGSGANDWTVCVRNSSGSPLDGVEVWITTDVEGTNTVAGTLTTDATGNVSFLLDAGTYYVWRQLAGYNFVNPTQMIVG